MKGELSEDHLKAQDERDATSGDEELHEVLFIDENTPTPELPQRQPYVPVNRRRKDGDEVLYIGPE